MKNDHYCVVHLLSDFRSRERGVFFMPDFRIVMRAYSDDHGSLMIEWRHDDQLGRDAWNVIELTPPQEELCEALAALLVHALGAWPSWFPGRRPEHVRRPDVVEPGEYGATIHVCEMRCWNAHRSSQDLETLRLTHLESADRYSEGCPLRHHSFLESMGSDILGEPGWASQPFETSSRRDDPTTQLVENLVTLLDLRFGDEDHRREMYRAKLVEVIDETA